MSDWKEIYKQKLVSVEEAASRIESGDKCWLGPCSAAPIQLMEAICDRVKELENVDIVTGMALYPFKFFQSPDFIGRINFNTIFYGAAEKMFNKSWQRKRQLLPPVRDFEQLQKRLWNRYSSCGRFHSRRRGIFVLWTYGRRRKRRGCRVR